MRTLDDLKVGDTIYFRESDPCQVKAKRSNFIIAVELGEGKHYTIIDTDTGYCGPHDRLFNPYDFRVQEDVEDCLTDMINGRDGIQISRRHGAPVELVIDMGRTLGGKL